MAYRGYDQSSLALRVYRSNALNCITPVLPGALFWLTAAFTGLKITLSLDGRHLDQQGTYSRIETTRILGNHRLW